MFKESTSKELQVFLNCQFLRVGVEKANLGHLQKIDLSVSEIHSTVSPKVGRNEVNFVWNCSNLQLPIVDRLSPCE